MEKDNKSLDAKDKILEAALELFSLNGFYATTTRRIAELADVNEVTLFRHFKSKKDLFDEILNKVRALGMDANRLDHMTLPPRELIITVIDEMIRLAEDYPREFRVLVHANLDEVEGFHEEFAFGNFEKALKHISRAFESLQKEGKTHSQLEPEAQALMLITLIYGSVTRRLVMPNSPGDHYSREELANVIVRLFLKDD